MKMIFGRSATFSLQALKPVKTVKSKTPMMGKFIPDFMFQYVLR
jgi:hypothetical protein